MCKNFDYEQVNTDILSKRFAEEDDLDEFLNSNCEYFSEGVLHKELSIILENTDYTIKDVVENTYVDRSYLYQIFRGVREPSRNKLIQILIFLRPSIHEMNRILKVAGKSPLYMRNKRDVVIIHSINKGLDLDEIEELLIDKGMESLS